MVLAFVLEKEKHNLETSTASLFTYQTASAALSIKKEGIVKALKTLRKHGLVERLISKHGNGGGISYRTTEAGRNLLDEFQSGPDRPEPPCSSSINTTPTDKDLLALFAANCDRYDLTSHQIGPNEIMQVWRSGAFSDVDDLISSVQHIGYYLSNPQNREGIRNPRTWSIQTLKKGIYAPPPDFESWEERQERLALEQKQIKLQRLQKLRSQRFEVDFGIWLEESADDELREVLGPDNKIFARNPRSAAAVACLRKAFAKRAGIDLELMLQAE